MTWTYLNSPSNTNRDAVRLLIGDTDHSDQLLQDEEIAWALTQEPGVYKAAALCARTLMGRFARKVDRAVGDLRISFSNQAKQYADLAKELDLRAVRSDGTIYAGGISEDDKETTADDTDRVKPAFARRMHDNPGADDEPDESRDFDDDT